MAVDEFEIKRVIRNRNLDEGNSSRSLVFKISKRTNKGVLDSRNSTSDHSILIKEQEVLAPLNSSPEPKLDDNISIKNLNETGAAGITIEAAPLMKREISNSVGQVAVNVGSDLRRTSKRIYLRKTNFEMSDKSSAGEKIKEPSNEKAKQGPISGKMGRRGRRGRKSIPTAKFKKCCLSPPSVGIYLSPNLDTPSPQQKIAINPTDEPIRRGPGRPRTVKRPPSVEKTAKTVPVKISKPPKKSLMVANPADSSSVWTLVPKEFVNSDYFKSHIMKIHQKAPRGRRPKKMLGDSYVPRTSFSSREDTKVPFPNLPPRMTKFAVEQHPGPVPSTPSRPTVIYFKNPNSGNVGDMEKKPPLSNQINFSGHEQFDPVSSEQSHLPSYRNDAALGYFHGFAQKNMKRDDKLLRDRISGQNQITADDYIYSNQQYHLQNHLPKIQETKLEPYNEFALQSNKYCQVPESPPEHFISCRQVIADAIRILYDDESVLGYD